MVEVVMLPAMLDLGLRIDVTRSLFDELALGPHVFVPVPSVVATITDRR
jgi:hypothetical protein